MASQMISYQEHIEEVNTLKLQLAQVEAELNWYREQFKLLQRQKYSAKSEKVPKEQLSLFNEAEFESDESVEEPTYEEITYQRKKGKRRSQEELIKNLPVEVIEYTLEEEERLCPKGHGPMRVIGKEVTREIAVIPAKTYVIEHVQYKYACEPCQVHGIDTPVKAAPKPKRAIPGSIASSSLIAHIIDQKYTMGMPLYRQEQQFQRQGVRLSRQNLANWVIKASEWFDVIYKRLHEYLLKEEILHADETTVQVLQEVGKKATSKSFMWLYRTGKYTAHPIVWFDYQPSRSGEHVEAFLKDFKGYLHTDGYSGYNHLDVIRVGCWAHARRKFKECLEALGKDKKVKPLRTLANAGFNYCQALYRIENTIRDLSIKERYIYRQEHSLPIVEAFSTWLQTNKDRVLPRSSLGKAIEYSMNQMKYLKNYLLDGRLEMDNNRAERSIKPFVMGRKGWLFSHTPKGARASAMIYSIVETVKENHLKPYEYIKYLLDTLPQMDITDLEAVDQLLPWSKSIPEECRMKK